jgi:glucose/mannose transport system permease protein
MTAEAQSVAAALAPRRNWQRTLRLGRVATYTVLVVAAVWYIIPVYLLFTTGLKGFAEANNQALMWKFPTAPSFQSFEEAWRAISPNFINSVRIAVPAALISSAIGSINGYILSKWRFRGSETFFTLILFGMFIPYQAILIPLFQVVQRLGLYGSVEGLILTHVIYGIPITTLIFRNYYVAIPDELIEASKVDGASFFGIYRHILLPLSVPDFVVVLIWQFTSAWNDFLFGSLLASSKNWPITVAVNNLAGSFEVAWNVQMAGALIAAIPTLLIYILLGRFFMRGLLAGSLKG